MNLKTASSRVRRLAFRVARAVMAFVPGGRISAFGRGDERIGSILVVNLDRQPDRWRRVLRELGRFRTFDGTPLTSITERLAAIDARDGRAVAASADVDPNYSIGDQLYVQPDTRLAACFGRDEPIRMTRQEIAVARSHIEVWKRVAIGRDRFVLVLEDDVWFKPGAAGAIARGWRSALQRCHSSGGPRFLYLSYDDAGGTATRVDACEALFRPVRGLWFLSGYVLSRDGAATLLRAMPVVGPVDTWINYRFKELDALALSTPAIVQREDSSSANSYSVLPYLARAGIVDTSASAIPPTRTSAGPVLAWTAGGEHEGLAMALSMLGLRVRAFDGGEKTLGAENVTDLLETFDALIDPPLRPQALSAITSIPHIKFISEANTPACPANLPTSSTVDLSHAADGTSWLSLCAPLGLEIPVQAFPTGARRELRVFRDDRVLAGRNLGVAQRMKDYALDDSPWVLPLPVTWHARQPTNATLPPPGDPLLQEGMRRATPFFPNLEETFPGNLAAFTRDGVTYDLDGVHLTLCRASSGTRSYRSGAFASTDSFEYGRFEAEIRAARGAGLVTGFFLHRDKPRQEIDVELVGNDPRRMLVNVYFNPGDDGTQLDFGYRGAPCYVDLDFDATSSFHLYSVDWQPGRISWSVDGRVVHERVGWEPTPIPFLPMRLHANLWAPRSNELAGRINESALPSRATFKNVAVWRNK